MALYMQIFICLNYTEAILQLQYKFSKELILHVDPIRQDDRM